MTNEFGVHFSSRGQLFERDPLIGRVGLSNTARSKDDLVLQFFQDATIGAVRDCA